MPVIDFTDVQDFVLIDEGVYGATIVNSQLKRAKTGSQMITLTFKIEDEPYDGRTLMTNLVLHPNALWRVKAAMIALGWDADDLDGEVEADPEDFLELAARISVNHREYQGQMRPNIADILPYDYEEPEPEADADEL